jgi:hypothetical protein
MVKDKKKKKDDPKLKKRQINPLQKGRIAEKNVQLHKENTLRYPEADDLRHARVQLEQVRNAHSFTVQSSVR